MALTQLNIFINDLDDGIACVLIRFETGWTARMSEDKVKIENDLHKIEKWAVTNKMLFRGEEFLCRKRNDQLHSMIWGGHKLKGNEQYYVDVDKVNNSKGHTIHWYILRGLCVLFSRSRVLKYNKILVRPLEKHFSYVDIVH